MPSRGNTLVLTDLNRFKRFRGGLLTKWRGGFLSQHLFIMIPKRREREHQQSPLISMPTPARHDLTQFKFMPQWKSWRKKWQRAIKKPKWKTDLLRLDIFWNGQKINCPMSENRAQNTDFRLGKLWFLELLAFVSHADFRRAVELLFGCQRSGGACLPCGAAAGLPPSSDPFLPPQSIFYHRTDRESEGGRLKSRQQAKQ